VFVPGIMGSELYLGDQLIWPGPPGSLIFKYQLMEQLLKPDLQIGDVIRSFSVSEQYGSIIDDLGRCNFSEARDTLCVCPYDWRKKNEAAAEVLAQKIEALSQRHRGDQKITIIAHSMGGLVARYYLESGLFTKREGFRSVQSLITLGTPHRGAPLALTAAMGMEKRLFLSSVQVRELVNQPDFPSVYQLLPSPDEQFAWDDRNAEAAYVPFAVYQNASDLRLNADNLQAAIDFRSKLAPLPQTAAGPRYFCFVGTRMPTLAHLRIIAGPDRAPIPLREEIEDAGDGTVPSWSGGVPGVQGRFVGGEHGTIYKDRGLLRTLATLLRKSGVLAAESPKVRVAVRDQVLNPRDSVHVILTFPAALRNVQGKLLLQEVVTDAQGNLVEAGLVVESYPVRYEGLGAETLGLTFTAPSSPGIYRIGFSESAQISPDNADDFFVQS
jgi:pimeloyl-ACP methyl ester carboxylesterase